MRSLSLQPEMFKDGRFRGTRAFQKTFLQKFNKKSPLQVERRCVKYVFSQFHYNPKSGCGTSVNLSSGYPKLLGSSKSSNVTFL